jgi:protein-S-isoprenylcysteine O-methyltransferase Ste14
MSQTHAAVEAPPKASPAIRRLGRTAYRYRQSFQLITLAIALLLGRSLGSRQSDLTLLWVSMALVALGGGIRSWAMGHHTWRRVYDSPAKERSLVTAGPYALTRNPLYLGTFLIGAGIAANSGWPILLAVFVPLFVVAHFLIIRWEESKLIDEFPGQFPRYTAEVPRLFPGLRRSSVRTGSFDLPTMIRTMEPIKTAGFIVVLVLMYWLKVSGYTPAF